MKKIILILLSVFLLISNLTDLQAGNIFGKFETGTSLNHDNINYVLSEIGYKFNLDYMTSKTSGGWTTWFEGTGSGKPFEDIYYIQQVLYFGNFYLRVYHYCAHRVTSLRRDYVDEQGNYMYSEYMSNRNWWYGKITTVSAGYEFEF